VTPFGAILKETVQAAPNAFGGAFAASDGEMVDAYATIDAFDFAVLTAYYGVVLANLSSLFDIWHFGGPQFFIAEHTKVGVLVHAVDAGYFALLAFNRPSDVEASLGLMSSACDKLREEMA
jgi:hypothetical protein